MKSIAIKLKRAAGFTLAETLMTVLILLMVSAVVAGGMPAAMNAYRKAVDAANAQLLLSTTVNALRDELSTAWDVEVEGTTITYQSSDTGEESIISLGDDGKIMLQEYAGEIPDWIEEKDPAGNPFPRGDKRPLVSDAMTKGISKDLTVSYTGAARFPSDTAKKVEYVKITGLEVKRGTDTVAKMPDDDGSEKVLLIRVLTGGEGA